MSCTASSRRPLAAPRRRSTRYGAARRCSLELEGVVKVWSLDKGELVTTLAAAGATSVNGLAFVDQGKGLAAALGGKNVVVWDVARL